MDRLDNVFRTVMLVALVCALGQIATLRADTGHEGAIRKEEGSYAAVRSVNVTSTTGTELWAVSVKRPDGVLINNSAFLIWIGTVSGTYNGVEHPNITNGFPVLSSSTFRLDGSYTGVLYGTSGSGQGTVNARILDGQVR